VAPNSDAMLIGLRDDVRAWQDGSAQNWGWLMNTAFTNQHPSSPAMLGSAEYPVYYVPPQLLVSYSTTSDATLGVGTSGGVGQVPVSVFRQGRNGYASQIDTYLSCTNPTVNYSAAPQLFFSAAVTSCSAASQAVLSFEDIVGAGAGQVSPGAYIHRVQLMLYFHAAPPSIFVHGIKIPVSHIFY
jgi:hypothetical protein